jgi:hypothetical protein
LSGNSGGYESQEKSIGVLHLGLIVDMDEKDTGLPVLGSMN